MRSLLRHAVGFLVAPLAVPALLLPWAVLREGSRDAPPGYVASIVRDSVASIVTEAIPLAYGLSLAFGIPLLLALRAVGRAIGPWVVGTAAGLGALFAAAVLQVVSRSNLGAAARGCSSWGPARYVAGP